MQNISLANATGDVIAVLVEVRDSLSPIRTELVRKYTNVVKLSYMWYTYVFLPFFL